MGERIQALLRFFILPVSFVILIVWKGLIDILVILHWVHVLILGKRLRGLATFCDIWNTQFYTLLKYKTFVSNDKPFPFGDLKKNISKFEK